MADVKYLPPEPAAPEVAGGRTRASVLVDLAPWPAIRQRLELNERLLAGTCGNDVDESRRGFGPEDLDLLLLITRERFGAKSALLRSQAVVALGTFDAEEAVQRLVDLAVAPTEVDGIRIAALGALGADRAGDLLDDLAGAQSPLVRGYAQRMRGDVAPQRYGRPRQMPRDTEADQGVRVHPRSCECCR